MTKAEFVDKLAEKGKITKMQATEAIELIFTTMAESLVAGKEISVLDSANSPLLLEKLGQV